MASTPLRVITLLKRRADLSLDAFIAHYEDHHRVIGEKYLRGKAIGYRRKFLRPMATPAAGEDAGSPFDVVMEIDFADAATMASTFASLQTPEAQAEIVADEERLFDRSQTCSFIEELHVSDMD